MKGLNYISMNASGDFMITGGASQLIRRIEATSWTRIRIGVRWAIEPYLSNATINGTPKLFLGVCNYDKGGVGSRNSNVHFVGTGTNTANAPFSAGSGGNPGSYNFATSVARRIFQTFTYGTTPGVLVPVTPLVYTSMYAVEVNKRDPAQTLISHFRASSTNFGAVTQDEFFEQMEAATPSISSYTYNTLAPTFNIDEATNGVLDAVNFYWDRSQIPIYIYDFCWSILA